MYRLRLSLPETITRNVERWSLRPGRLRASQPQGRLREGRHEEVGGSQGLLVMGRIGPPEEVPSKSWTYGPAETEGSHPTGVSLRENLSEPSQTGKQMTASAGAPVRDAAKWEEVDWNHDIGVTVFHLRSPTTGFGCTTSTLHPISGTVVPTVIYERSGLRLSQS